MTSKQHRILLIVFFFTLLLYFRIVISFGLTTVHPDIVDLALRNQGMLLSYLDLWNSSGLMDILHKLRLFHDYAMVGDWGALQFFLLNIFLLIIGDSFPLTPAVMLFPKVIIASLTGIYAYLLGKEVHSPKLGFVFAMAFSLAPWFAISLRFSSWYSLLVPLLHLTTLYYYTMFIRNPYRPLFRFMAPLSLAIYLTTGLDWPFFIPLLIIYLILNRSFMTALHNWYNIIPALIFLSHIAFAIRLFLTGEYGFDRWKRLFVIYPFTKIILKFGNVNLHGGGGFFEVLSYLFRAYGVAWFISLLVATRYIFKTLKSRQITSDLYYNFCLLNSCWLIILLYPFLKSGSDHLTYAFVLAVPIIFLACVMIAKMRWRYIIIFLLSMGFLQWCVFFNFISFDDYRIKYRNDDDSRVVAVAYFLIEKRPDLLDKGKVGLMPLLPPGTAGNPGYIDHYVKGFYTPVLSWLLWPLKEGVPEPLLNWMNTQDKKFGNDILLHIDWVVLSNEIVSADLPWGGRI